MTLNKQKGNMYGFVTHTWNPIKGKCLHDCSYCYMKVWKQKPLRLVEKELQDDLGKNNFIFVGSSTDMFAEDVPDEWITSVLSNTIVAKSNKYLLQTKNSRRMYQFHKSLILLDNYIYGVTIESNRFYPNLSNAPLVDERRRWMILIRKDAMVSIEPILDFDLEQLVQIIREIHPIFVSIGADSKGHKLPEPPKEKIESLINELKKFTEVKLKPNLNRLLQLSQDKRGKR